MKKIALAAVMSVAATSAFAGGLAPAPEPMMEPAPQPEVMVEEESSSSGGFVVPILLLAVVAAVAATD